MATSTISVNMISWISQPNSLPVAKISGFGAEQIETAAIPFLAHKLYFGLILSRRVFLPIKRASRK